MFKRSSKRYASLANIVVKSTFGKVLTVIFDITRNFIFIKFLSVELFGLFSICNNVVQSSKYFDLGFANKFLIDAYDGKLNSDTAKSVFSAIILFEFFFLSLIGCIFFVFSHNKKIFDLPSGADGLSSDVIILLGFTLFAARLFKLSIIWRRHMRQYVTIAKIEFVLSLTVLGFSLIVLKEDFSQFIRIYFLGQTSILILSSLVTFRDSNLAKPMFSWLIKNIKTSLTLTTATLIFGLSFYLDRYILLSYFSFMELGYYAALLFVLNIMNTITSYMIEPIRASLAESFSSSDHIARYLLLNKIALFAGIVLVISGVFLIKLLMPIFSQLVILFAPKYSLVIPAFEMVFKICLTFPLLFILGYLVVAKPYNKTLFFALSQFSGVIAISISFWILNFDQSIYWILLFGIYYGNIIKIYIYFGIMTLERKSSKKHAKLVIYLMPFVLVPWI